MHIHIEPCESCKPNERHRKEAHGSILSNLLGEKTLEEVVLSLIMKDLYPHSLLPGLGFQLDDVMAARDAMRQVTMAVAAKKSLKDVSLAVEKFKEDKRERDDKKAKESDIGKDLPAEEEDGDKDKP